jgi:hypothetical protein
LEDLKRGATEYHAQTAAALPNAAGGFAGKLEVRVVASNNNSGTRRETSLLPEATSWNSKQRSAPFVAECNTWLC